MERDTLGVPEQPVSTLVPEQRPEGIWEDLPPRNLGVEEVIIAGEFRDTANPAWISYVLVGLVVIVVLGGLVAAFVGGGTHEAVSEYQRAVSPFLFPLVGAYLVSKVARGIFRRRKHPIPRHAPTGSR